MRESVNTENLAPNRDLRGRARETIRTRGWSNVIGAVLLPFAAVSAAGIMLLLFSLPLLIGHSVSGLFTHEPGVLFEGSFQALFFGIQIAAAPLFFGLARYFILYVRGYAPPVFTVFHFYRRFFSSIWMRIVGVLYFAVLYILPCGFFAAVLRYMKMISRPDWILDLTRTAFVFVLYALALYLSVRVYAAYFVYADSFDALTPWQALLKACMLTRRIGVITKILRLWFSFIGWWFLCLFTCGIGFLFLSPYCYLSCAYFYQDLLDNTVAETVAEYDWD